MFGQLAEVVPLQCCVVLKVSEYWSMSGSTVLNVRSTCCTLVDVGLFCGALAACSVHLVCCTQVAVVYVVAMVTVCD
jgi:hypothetical protein